MLNDEALRPLEDALQRLRKAFAEKVSDHPRENSPSGMNQAASPGEKGVSRPSQTQLQVELNRVDAALERIQAGTYGACCRCDIDIDIEWLTEDPATPFCRTCFDELTTRRQKLRR